MKLVLSFCKIICSQNNYIIRITIWEQVYINLHVAQSLFLYLWTIEAVRMHGESTQYWTYYTNRKTKVMGTIIALRCLPLLSIMLPSCCVEYAYQLLRAYQHRSHMYVLQEKLSRKNYYFHRFLLCLLLHEVLTKWNLFKGST